MEYVRIEPSLHTLLLNDIVELLLHLQLLQNYCYAEIPFQKYLF